jgi:hypothetical protein
MDDHPPRVEGDVLPAQRDQLAEAKAGVGGETEQLAVLCILACAPRATKSKSYRSPQFVLPVAPG